MTHGNEPDVKNFATAEQEFDFVLGRIDELVEQGDALEDVCIVGRTNSIVQGFIKRLQNKGIRVYEIRRSKVDDRNLKGIRVATMHRIKGLEFKHIIVVSANSGTIPHQIAVNREDPVAQAAAMKAERCLLYVVLTRAKQTAIITSYGGMSEFISELLKHKMAN